MNLRQRTQKQVVYETCVFLGYRVIVNTLYISVLKKENRLLTILNCVLFFGRFRVGG